MKFHENILNGFWVTERARNYHCPISKGIPPKLYKQELWFLSSAHWLMMAYISIKFRENILNGFQVMERTRIYHCQISKENNSKTVWTRVTVYTCMLCTLSDNDLYFYGVSWKYLERFSSHRANMIAWQTDRQTDRQPRQKQYVSTTVRGRHYNKTHKRQ